jgi:hypothetical protein
MEVETDDWEEISVLLDESGINADAIPEPWDVMFYYKDQLSMERFEKILGQYASYKIKHSVSKYII